MLKLNFNLETEEERTQFATELTKNSPNLSSDDLELLSNYILYGKDKNGNRRAKDKAIERTGFSAWNEKAPESLDSLIEQPTFNEATLRPITSTPQKNTRVVFSRQKALATQNPKLRETFQNLFTQIDELELLLNYYDLENGRRKKPPRDELLNRVSPERAAILQTKAKSLTQRNYLKNRHLLVELRQEQFVLGDSVSTPLQQRHIARPYAELQENKLESEIPVYPFLKIGAFAPIFKKKGELNPKEIDQKTLTQIQRDYWRKQSEKRPTLYFDFTNPFHISNFLLELNSFSADARSDFEPEKNLLIQTLFYYIEEAELLPAYKEVLQLKARGKHNQEIADYINQKYEKSYTANYISTIFRQKATKAITEAAAYHEKVVRNLPFPENFKKCSRCGRLLLIGDDCFTKKVKSPDGYSARCKDCDSEVRKLKKEGKETK